jgi:mannose-1-phosphate guanylyltransferase/mannose-6-phosphate isomerase
MTQSHPRRTAQTIPLTPVILCGGSGTRLWPLSRAGFPKQFLCLTGDESLFQQAVRRLMALGRGAGSGTSGGTGSGGPADSISVAPPLVVANEAHRFLVAEQLRESGLALGGLLLEPAGRNTAPALTLAALAAAKAAAPQGAAAAGSVGSIPPTVDLDNDPVLVVTPADQTISDDAEFTAALQAAVRAAAGDAPQNRPPGDQPQAPRIVILGVPPDRPETGYGYIEVAASSSSSSTIHTVRRFVEKPDAATAQRYLAADGDSRYYWNAGIFVMRASVWLSAIAACRPDIASATEAAWLGRAGETGQDAMPFVRPDPLAFAAIPAESIDYAVMEKLTGSRGMGGHDAQQPSLPVIEVCMVPLNAGWSDLGAWDAVWQALPKDDAGNAHRGDVLTTDSRNTLVQAQSRLVALVGVDNLVVIETPDAVLVADRSRSQEVRQIVSRLNAEGRSEPELHRKVHRPWGWYDGIDEGDRFKVKRILVKPKASLSLQMHHHRAEHWVVVRGTAEVTCGDETRLLTENQSTYIPLGQVHRLANPGTIPLEIIEVQSGSYLGEDDIVRFDDRYGRAKG